jgi:hypothetical protein
VRSCQWNDATTRTRPSKTRCTRVNRTDRQLSLLCNIILFKEAAFFFVGLIVNEVVRPGLVPVQSGMAAARDLVESPEMALQCRNGESGNMTHQHNHHHSTKQYERFFFVALRHAVVCIAHISGAKCACRVGLTQLHLSSPGVKIPVNCRGTYENRRTVADIRDSRVPPW